MAFLRRLSLRQQLLLLLFVIVSIGFIVTTYTLTKLAARYQLESAMRYGTELAERQATTVTADLRQAIETANALAASLGAYSASAAPDRAAADAMLRAVLAANPKFLGTWAAFEPGAFDQNDSYFSNSATSDASGRFLSQMSRDAASGKLDQGVLVDYDKAGAGDYYQLPKNGGKPVVLEPFSYDFGNYTVLLTTVSFPIMRDGQFIGAAGVDISLATFQEIVQTFTPYETGYASLLSNSGIFVGDRDPSLPGVRLSQDLGLSAEELRDALAAIANGEKIMVTLHDPLLDAEATVIEVPIYFNGIEKPWAFAVTLPNDKILEDVTNLNWVALGLALLSILLTCLALAFAIRRMVLRPLGGEPAAAVAVAERVARGDFSQSLLLQGKDRHSVMYSLQTMQQNLAALIARIRQGSDSVSAAASEISAGNLDLSARTEEQSASLAQTAASMEEITATVRQNADNAQQASTLAATATKTAGQGGDIVERLSTTMEHINEHAQKIADIVGVIDSIAFQTNILALNAAVEAARAGEQGRGFAVVASEVRALAQRSATSAHEIRSIIQESVDTMGQGSELTKQAKDSMQGIVSDIRRVTDIMAEISVASREQTSGIEQINIALTQMDDVTRQNASLVEQSAAAASSMQDQAHGLSDMVAVFKLP